MIITIKNEHIFFAVESVWENINYKFRYMLNELVTANPDDEYLQTIDVPEDILIQVFSTITVLPEGVANYINREMLELLLPQITEVSNIVQVKLGLEQPNEAARLLISIEEIDNANKAVKAAKILNGKATILA